MVRVLVSVWSVRLSHYNVTRIDLDLYPILIMLAISIRLATKRSVPRCCCKAQCRQSCRPPLRSGVLFPLSASVCCAHEGCHRRALRARHCVSAVGPQSNSKLFRSIVFVSFLCFLLSYGVHGMIDRMVVFDVSHQKSSAMPLCEPPFDFLFVVVRTL